MDLLCFSHLRWNFVFQRPNHLLTRAARTHRVFFIEEPIRDATMPYASLTIHDGVNVVVPHIASQGPADSIQLRYLLDRLVIRYAIEPAPVLWYYTPMALPWTTHLHAGASAVVYDCMDHLASFRDAPPQLVALERDLLHRADLVFTGGQSLFEARRSAHRSVHCFPSSVDVAHFGTARSVLPSPPDQTGIPRPRIGYFGVLDERIDWSLIGEVSVRRPDWQLVLVGPTAKVNVAELPQAPNIHYLGPRSYDELPAYLAGWDAAIMPFARNEATRYISPTKTPEYLAGGRAVASTSIRDVVHPYGDMGLVHIGDTPDEFIVAVTRALDEDPIALREQADAFLSGISWEQTWSAMRALIDPIVAASRRPTRRQRRTVPAPAPMHSIMSGGSQVATSQAGGLEA